MPMGRLTRSSALALWALTLAAPVSGGQLPAPGGGLLAAAPPRQLSKADAEWVSKKYAVAVTFGRAGNWGVDGAQAPVREILDLCKRELGEDHYKTRDYRLELEALQKLAALPPAGRVEYMKTYTLSDEASEFEKQARYEDALRPAEQIVDIYRRLLGPKSFLVALAANRYGILLHYCDRYDEAEKHFREAIAIVRELVGESNPGIAATYGNLAMTLERLGKYDEARRLYDDALAITIRLRGEGDPGTAVAYNNLAGSYERLALYTDAEPLYRKAVDILKAAEGQGGDRLATAYNNLALNLHHQGRFDEAEKAYQAARQIRLNTLGEDHADTGRVYMNLATNRDAQGDYANSEPLYRKALDNYRKAYGPNSSQTAWALNNLALNLNKQGKVAEAEEKLREALAIVMRAPTEQSREVAKISNNLASCLQAQEKYAEAAGLCEKALATLRDKLGPSHPDVAVALNNVAKTFNTQGRYEDAERLFLDALDILKRRLGEDHPETAEARVNLAINLYHQGRYDETERLLRQALDTQRRVLGEGHPMTARTYRSLVVNHCMRGDHEGAGALGPAAVRSFEIARRRISFSGLDRAGRADEISPYPALAAVAARAGKPEAAWQALEQNLARGLLDDLSARPLSDDERRREQELLDRLDLLDRPVAARSAEEVRRQRDAAQAEFAAFQADLVARHGVPAGEVYTLARIQERLNDDTALLAWVDLPDETGRVDKKGDHWACLVRRRGEPIWVRLSGTGTNGEWTDDDGRLALQVRRALAQRPTDDDGQWKDLAHRLALQRLAPLKSHLAATANLPAVRHLVVLPCAKMAAVPLDALPLDVLPDRPTVSYAPSGTMFAYLQERGPRQEAPAGTLLALGDPAFQPPPGERAAPKGGAPGPDKRRDSFTPLPGTRQELMGIARVFDERRLLTGPRASERSLDQLVASGELGTFRFLHFATHGVLDDRRPMRSALILAPDPPAVPGSPPAGAEARDGRLTAEHILRHWKLNAELVTLSACDTGLGKFSGGEGYLGFSQALFLCGANSLVLSLWPVDDVATALLMARFYENVLGTPEKTVKPLPKAEALAEAKKWLRSLGPQDVAQLSKDLPIRGTSRGRVVPQQESDTAKAPRTYEHPYYWSGFILVGDPR
jgi:CHAT domain-containing protein/tetratricopeptide (TPR) repeat protein